ncbi:MAG: serine/threonine-protein kinase [Myxococcota bacterium]
MRSSGIPLAGLGANPVDDPFLGSSYRAVRFLGASGMGELHVVVHRNTGREFIGKILAPDRAAQPQSADRFRVEAQSLGRVDHPNVVKIAAVGNAADGRPFIVLEYLTGRSLAAVLAECGQVPVLEAIRYTCELLSALSAAHALGIVHRDVKPDNLFICERPDRPPYLKLLDFGVARILPSAPPRAPAPLSVPTATGAAVGTPRYMSPEAALAERDVDIRADIYAAALVLYLMLCSRGPFDHADGVGALLLAHAAQEPEPPSHFASDPVPPELDRAILRALRKDRGERFQSADEFREALERIANGLRMPAGWLETSRFAPVPPRARSLRAEQSPSSHEEEPTPIDSHETAQTRAGSNGCREKPLAESGPRVRRPFAMALDGEGELEDCASEPMPTWTAARGLVFVFIGVAAVTAVLAAVCVFAWGRAHP